ncbi:hypothetical protein [Allostreptomyces psammosilenae]|uniref:non-specific serine/threonine protein kinase n=1 Tax=Allostreptomyces psammosilenae TaxID=1892865 RepID=A0A852ZZJ7_9ACTN|nr:hypothetical protein [Allostreptomyces psammosilenae]NYI03548.1 hypothetical protein [Allostreptomyces psammosilenae]
MVEPRPGGDLRTVLGAVAADESGDHGAALAELAAWQPGTWSELLLRLPFDAPGFRAEYERGWQTVIGDLDRWCRAFPDRPAPFREQHERVSGYVGLLLVTLVCLHHSYVHRHPGQWAREGGPGTVVPTTHDCAALCAPLFERPAVRAALRELYDPHGPVPTGPAETGPDPLAREAAAEWAGIDFDTLRFHRHGTTSFILRGLPALAVQGRRRPLALKCVVHPYLRVPAIVRSTREYRRRYDVTGVEDITHLVRVWASAPAWILMDFVAGNTLADHLAARQATAPDRPAAAPGARRPPSRRGSPPTDVDLDQLGELGGQLFAALAELERAGLHHLDLSPSNVIVTRRDDRLSFVLVDLGANHLYTHAVTGLEGPDARYVAPEVRAGGDEPDRADLYSLGQLLLALAGPPPSPDGTVPDALYSDALMMARFIEDLTDASPANRLLLFPLDAGRPVYPQLRRYFDEELDALSAAREESDRSPAWLFGPRGMYTPLAGAPARQLRVWRIRRSQGVGRGPGRDMYARWLVIWSWIAAVAWVVGAATVIVWWSRDIGGVPWGPDPVAVIDFVTRSDTGRIPLLDDLRADDYPLTDALGNLPVRMVCLSFLMAGARLYQNIFAGITTRVTGLRQGRLTVLAALTELQLRLFALIPIVLVTPPTLVQREWWPVFTGIGVTAIFLCNLTCTAFVTTALGHARDRSLSTVPSGRVAGREEIRGWAATSAFYGVAVWTIASLLVTDRIHDQYVYAGSATAINLVIFYAVKCGGRDATDVRVALGRACLAAERLRHLPTAPPVSTAGDGRGRPDQAPSGVPSPMPGDAVPR